MQNIAEFNVYAKDGSISKRAVKVEKLCFGLSCSRDIEGTRKTLIRKRAEGYLVQDNPAICRKSRYLLTNEDVIEVQGPQTSGEVEIVAIMDDGEVLISVGSDHNDRTLEVMWSEKLGKIFDSAKSKQMCPAVVANDAWRYEDLRDHWDMLNLRSRAIISGRKIPLQDFKLVVLVDLEYHFRTSPWLREDGTILFGGSYNALPEVPPDLYPPDFHFEVHDPILNRTISHSYTVQCIEG